MKGQFYALEKYDKQQSFSRGCIVKVPVKRHYVRSLDGEGWDDSKRTKTFKYYVETSTGKIINVCKNNFMNIFGISRKRASLLCAKVAEEIIDVSESRRGPRQFFKRSEWTKNIIDHIASFPADNGRYNRADSPNIKYLSGDLTLSIMYKAFQTLHTNKITEDKPPVSCTWYSNIFKKNFHLSFRKARTDTCGKCDELKNKELFAVDSNEKQSAMNSLLEHYLHVEKSQQMFKKDKRDLDNYVVNFDLQQQIGLPKLTHSKMYYSRQLNCFNLGIHDERKNMGMMCLWTEDYGNRGSTEIATCLYDYFVEEVGVGYMRKLVLWTDTTVVDKTKTNSYWHCILFSFPRDILTK